MKKALSLIAIVSIFLLSFTQSQAQSIATNSSKTLEKYSQLRKCLSYSATDKNNIQLTGNNLPVNETIYIVDCVTSPDDFICTTGNKNADEILHISKPNPPSFSLIGSSNPMVTRNGILKINAKADLTGGKIHIFSAVVLVNITIPNTEIKGISFGKLNFFDQNLAECQIDKNLNSTSQAILKDSSSDIPVTGINYGVMTNNNKTFIVGKISQPSTKITFSQNGKILSDTTSNKYGAYSILIDNKTIDQTSQIGISYKKVRTSSLLPNFFVVNAQNTMTAAFMIDPIFSYIEGYAYDATGKTLASATINIKLKNSNDIYYTTNANSQGFFTIAPEFLPIYAYEIEIKNPTSKIVNKQQTQQFASKNKDYLTKNKINMITATKNDKSLVKAANTSISKSQLPKPTTIPQKKLAAIDDPNSIVFTLIVLLVIVSIIGVTLYFLYKNNTYDKDDKHLL